MVQIDLVHLVKWSTLRYGDLYKIVQPGYTTSNCRSTTDATFDITGFRLEVGSVATDFEHRSFGTGACFMSEIFFTEFAPGTGGTSIYVGSGSGVIPNGQDLHQINFPVTNESSTNCYYYQWY